MGEARTKKELAEAYRQGRIEIRSTLLPRIFKGITCMLIWPFCFCVWTAREGYRQNKWPWELE